MASLAFDGTCRDVPSANVGARWRIITVSLSTSSNACTNLFNGGSGNLLVKPYSGFTYNDPYDGFVVSTSQRYVYLDDLGSGVTYKIFVLGLD